MNIVLLGYMASGKSLIGKELAKKLNYDFIDLDDYIVANERSEIAAIFKEKGEIYFRKVETRYLKEIISEKDKVVLALGGGTPCYANNMDVLNEAENCKTLYLKTSMSTLVKRLDKETDKRPLISHLSSEDQLSEFIGKHLFERSYFYNQADLSINTDNKKSTEIIEDIIFELF